MIRALSLALIASVAFVSAAEARPRLDANGNFAIRQVIGHRPSGCPHAWCGCGLARYLGLHDRRLDLAWNWAKLFPHTDGHRGAAGVRRHHVVLVERHIEGTLYLVRDFNGGHGLAWLHVRNLRGYVFVQPPARMGAI